MDLDRATMLQLYRTMATIRQFEERGIPETGAARYVGLGTFLGRAGGGADRHLRQPER